MDQDDFRRLLTSGPPQRVDRSTIKRTRDQAFGASRRRTTASSSAAAAILAPRKVKGTEAAQSSGHRRDGHKSLLADGYIDRAKQRGLDTQASKAQDEIEALRSSLKNKEISHKEYLARLSGLETGEFSGAGIVRGLDRKLLERVRAGEDVFASTEEQVEKERALERALEQNLSKDAVPPQKAASRDSLLAAIKKTKSEAAQKTEKPLKKVIKGHADGTTSETFEQDGKKIKIIRDANGTVMKRLIRKVQPDPMTAISPAVQSKAVSVSNISDKDTKPEIMEALDDVDIFEDAGDYDPFADSLPNVSSTRNDFATQRLFDMEKGEDEEGIDLPTDAKDFLRQNKEALEKAATIVDRQSKTDQERIAARKKTDAGFGLIFRDGDAYANDLREVPEDDEMYDPKQRNKRKLGDK